MGAKQKGQGTRSGLLQGVDTSADVLRKRQRRFSDAEAASPRGADPEVLLFSRLAQGAKAKRVRGTSSALERPYLRLTGAVDASTVRPPRVLRQALELATEGYVSGEWSYARCREQLKSIRQDATVQECSPRLSVSAYAAHARMAVVEGDAPELTQCLGRLRELREWLSDEDRSEFAAYRVLHAAMGNQVWIDPGSARLVAGDGLGVVEELRGLSDTEAGGYALRTALRAMADHATFRMHRVERALNTAPALVPTFLERLAPVARARCRLTLRAALRGTHPEDHWQHAAVALGALSREEGDVEEGEDEEGEGEEGVREDGEEEEGGGRGGGTQRLLRPLSRSRP